MSPASLPVGFTHPAYLVSLALLPVLCVIARRAAGRRARGGARRAPGGPWPLWLWLRLTVALLVVLALAGLRVPAPPKSVATVFVVDQSESVPADIREGAKGWVRQALEQSGPDDLAAIVTFGREARVELPLGRHRNHPQWGDPAASRPAGDATDIAQALELAAGLLPPPSSGALRRLVLLSDGHETRGDARRALLRPALHDVEVAAVALPQRLGDTALTGFAAPPALREGEPADLRLAVQSPEVQQATLRVWANDQLIAERSLTLESGPGEVPVATGGLAKGFWAFRAELAVARDSRPENNQSWAYTVVGEPARVLLVEGSPGEAAAVRRALEAAQIEVDGLRPQELPASEDQLDRLLAYESIVLANVPAGDLRREQMELLRRYVAEQGRGLVVLGGEHTFGLGDYAGTPLEAALPVSVAPPDQEQASTLALVLLIDKSGSMAATDTADRRTDRMSLAREGAILAVETLKEGDQVGVIAFDSTAQWIADVRPIRGPADVRAVADQIATLRSDGGTGFSDALTKAYQGLQQVQARVKHVILLTDGEAPETGLPQLLAAMRRAGITVSTVGVSGDISGQGRAVLQRIAAAGQGRSYFTNTADDVPQVLTQETRLAGRSFKQERDFTPRLAAAASAVRALAPAAFPQLHGYVRVSPKPGAETVLTSDQGEAILAQWQYGTGRALVWTADAGGAWAADWTGHEHFGRLWPQAVRWTMPAPLDPRLQVTVRADGEQAVVRVESAEPTGEFRNLLETFAEVAHPDGAARRVALPQVALPQVAPGRYEGAFPLDGPGVYAIRVVQREGGAVVAEATTGYALPHLPEYALLPPNRVLLERLAADTGAPVVDRPERAWRRDTGHGWQPQDVWDRLVAVALALFVADVALRRFRPALRDLGLAGDRAGAALCNAAAALRGRGWRLPRPALHPEQSGRRRA